jgi:hypothetical protein
MGALYPFRPQILQPLRHKVRKVSYAKAGVIFLLPGIGKRKGCLFQNRYPVLENISFASNLGGLGDLSSPG